MMFTPMLTQMLTCFGDLCVDLVARTARARRRRNNPRSSTDLAQLSQLMPIFG